MVDLPRSLDAESAIVGAILLDPDHALIRTREIVRPSDFFDWRLGEIYCAALELGAAGRPIDVVSLADVLERRNQLARVGGVSLLGELAGHVPTAENVAYYARLVHEKAVTRQVKQAAARICASDAEGADLLQEATDELRLISLPSSQTIIPAREVVSAIYQEARKVRDEGPEAIANLAGVPTGIEAFDRKLTYGGIPRRCITVLAGATSAGKSALANTCVLGACKRGKSALVVALEDSAKAVTCRMLSPLCGISNRELQRRIVGASSWDSLERACVQLSDARLWFIDGWAGNVTDLTMAIRAHLQREPVDLVVIDFLQLLRSGHAYSKRQDEVDSVFGELVRMSGQIDAATLVVSQLRRTHNERPSKEDLYHSGAIEQWTNTVGLLWRPDVKGAAAGHCCALVLDKQKNGFTGEIVLGWNAEHVSYADPDPDVAAEYGMALGALREKQ